MSSKTPNAIRLAINRDIARELRQVADCTYGGPEQPGSPGPWAQGRLLLTKETARWGPSQLECAQARERPCVYANFSDKDQGRSRVLIAQCREEKDARLIALTPRLLDTLEALFKVAYWADNPEGMDAARAVLEEARACR